MKGLSKFITWFVVPGAFLVVAFYLAQALDFMELPTFETSVAEEVSGAEILEYGIYGKVKKSGRKLADSTTAGYTQRFSGMKFREITDRVPAKKGEMFGIRYRVLGKPEGAALELSVRLTHPPLRNPEKNEETLIEEWRQTANIGRDHFVGWMFEKQWESSPGRWVFALIHEGEVLAEKSFEVFLASAPS